MLSLTQVLLLTRKAFGPFCNMSGTMKFKIKILPAKVSFDSSDMLLDDAISQSIPLEYSCRTGDCGICAAEIVDGKVCNELGENVTEGKVLLCQSTAKSNLTLKASYYPQLVIYKQQTLPCKISTLKLLTQDIMLLKLRLPPTASFEYCAGQYIDLSFKGIKRSYSIANAQLQSQGELELHIRKVAKGQMSELVFNELRENTLMRMEGPKGTFFVRDDAKPIIFIATGTGIAPVKAMVEELISKQDPRKLFIYWGMRDEAEVYCEELIEIASKFDNVQFTPVLSRVPESNKPLYVQNAVCDAFESLKEFRVYACGSPQMIEVAKRLFLDKELIEENFVSDAFTAAK